MYNNSMQFPPMHVHVPFMLGGLRPRLRRGLGHVANLMKLKKNSETTDLKCNHAATTLKEGMKSPKKR